MFLLVSQTEQISFRTELNGLDSHPFVIPNVTVVGVNHLSRHVLLPIGDGSQSIEWSPENLIDADVNSPLADRESGDLKAFKLVGDDFDTLRGTTHRIRSDPYVRLCDLRTSWRGDRFHGDAVFDIDPATLENETP